MRPQVVERSAIVMFTAAQMFGLVDDVPRYPEFLPWCVAATSEAEAENQRLATVQVAHGVLRTAFTTRNTLQPGTAIDMALVDGPFSSLTGQWRFEPIGRGSRIRFRMEFEFNNGLMAAAFGRIFETACASIVDAFVQRARKIYG